MLSKFSGQIGPKPNVLCSIKKFDRSDGLAVLMEARLSAISNNNLQQGPRRGGGGGGGGEEEDVTFVPT